MEIQEFKKEIPEIFEKVKKDVSKVLRRHRAGLSLGLVEGGFLKGEDFIGFIGGAHYYPGHVIVMTKSPLKMILESQPYEIIWAYTYHILLHEYIHSLDIINEYQCREITLKVTEEVFKDVNHPAMILAKNGIGAFFPNLRPTDVPPEIRPEDIEYVHGFDRESQTYFS